MLMVWRPHFENQHHLRSMLETWAVFVPISSIRVVTMLPSDTALVKKYIWDMTLLKNMEKKMDLSEKLRTYSTVNNSRPTPQPANAMKNFSGSGQFEDSSVSRRDHQGSRSHHIPTLQCYTAHFSGIFPQRVGSGRGYARHL